MSGAAEVSPAAGAAASPARPAVSVVVPFAGNADHAQAVFTMLRSLRIAPGDELIVSDNSGTAGTAAGITVVRANREGSASHARNVGAAYAHNAWLLFLDSDVHPPPDLIDLFFSAPIGEKVGAMTGDIAGIPDTSTLAARYGTTRNFLGQRSHVNNPFRPRASSANLLVRRAAFEQVHGYTEGIWAAEDTDLTWRLQASGWSLEFNERAVVHHAYRDSLRALGKQWRGYAAGAMWLSHQYPDFKLDPALNRMGRRLLKRLGIGPGVAFRADGRSSPASKRLSRWQRLQFLAVDCMLGVNEKIGHRMSNHVEPREPQARQDPLEPPAAPAPNDPPAA